MRRTGVALWRQAVAIVRHGDDGQALPIAVACLAVGAILIVPLLSGAGTDSRYTAQVGAMTKERYSLDAAIEWSGWRLISDPRLSTDPAYDAAPLQLLPPAVNGSPFPTDEIRYLPAAGAVETQTPAWQGGGGDKCYTFSAAEAGTLSVRVTVDSGGLWLALLPAAAVCTRPPGLQAQAGASPYGGDLTLPAAGTYQLLIGVDMATTGTLSMSVPAATYDVRATSGSRTSRARIVAGYSGIRISSWQLN